MENFKEFKGKSLDAAIEEACSYFNTAREKLEIEIVQDAKSGIFGIVGARKAKIRARRVQLREAVESILGKREGGVSPLDLILDDPDDIPAAQKHSTVPRPVAKPHTDVEDAVSIPQNDNDCIQPTTGEKSTEAAEAPERCIEKSAEKSSGKQGERSARKSHTGSEKPSIRPGGAPYNASTAKGSNEERSNSNAHQPHVEHAGDTGLPSHIEIVDALEDDFEAAGEGLPITPLEQLDSKRLTELVKDTVRHLVRPIMDGDTPIEVQLCNGRVNVSIACDEDSGLLIGRDGQTLASLQYMVSRIVSRGMNAAVRVQLDAGEYRRRQDDKLRDMALSLAEKVRQTGRSYSTRPLSSYHRRIVHICLQDIPDMQTRSTGEGPLKRVVIMRKKEGA